jgi:hypothetical protein
VCGCSTRPTKSGRLRSALLDLLREHEADGAIPTSGRFLFYELEGRGVVSKVVTGARRADQDMSDALTSLREQGYIPWDWIDDETRSVNSIYAAGSVADWVLKMAARARIDPWDGDRPMIITESRSLAGVLRQVAYKYAVPICATNGQTGGFLHTDVAPLLVPDDQVIYLGDYDLAGGQIEANTRRVLVRCVHGPLRWERLAVTGEQVAQYNLPVIMKGDRRRKDGGVHQAVETEALSQSLLVRMLTDPAGRAAARAAGGCTRTPARGDPGDARAAARGRMTYLASAPAPPPGETADPGADQHQRV